MSLSEKQLSAMKLSSYIGRDIQRDLGQKISEAFRQGMTFPQMADVYSIRETYGASRDVALKALHCAIYGCEGNLGSPEYGPLIEKSEIESVRERRQKEHGLRVKSSKKGIHAMSDEERRKMAITNYQKLSADQKIRIRSMAAMGRGALPWSEEELVELRRCASDPEYQTSRGVNNIKIAKRLNDLFHDGVAVRNRITVYRASYRNDMHKAI